MSCVHGVCEGMGGGMGGWMGGGRDGGSGGGRGQRMSGACESGMHFPKDVACNACRVSNRYQLTTCRILYPCQLQ